MRLTVALFLLAAASQAVEGKGKHKTENVSKTDKRALMEGNAGIEKRAPVLSTASPSVTPGIEYAESKEAQGEKSPPQQIYATPGPQIAKISDVLTGQGPPFQSAITSHLYSPISVYQPRLGTPTTYEVSAPVASQLAYSEHKLSYQPQQNAIPYTPQVQYSQKLPISKEAIARLTANYQQPSPQQIYLQQPVYTQQQPQIVPQLYQQIPQVNYQPKVTYIQEQPQPIQYTQGAQVYSQKQIQQPVTYVQEQPQRLVKLVQPVQAVQSIQPVQHVQPRVVYAPVEGSPEGSHQQPIQRELKAIQLEQKEYGKQASSAEQNYNAESQGVTNYASFSQDESSPSYEQLQLQPQPQAQPQPQPQLQPQAQPQYIPAKYETPQLQYIQQQLPQYIAAKPGLHASLNVDPKQISYFRSGPASPAQPQLYHHQPQVLVQNPGHGAPQPVGVSPTFPPVQYFGKFAQAIFGARHH